MKKEFIQIGATRIKRSNIKTFGTSHSKVEGQGMVTAINKWSKGVGFFEGIKQGYSTTNVRYLFITTYQNDNYKFFESEIDIDETLKMLEE